MGAGPEKALTEKEQEKVKRFLAKINAVDRAFEALDEKQYASLVAWIPMLPVKKPTNIDFWVVITPAALQEIANLELTVRLAELNGSFLCDTAFCSFKVEYEKIKLMWVDGTYQARQELARALSLHWVILGVPDTAGEDPEVVCYLLGFPMPNDDLRPPKV